MTKICSLMLIAAAMAFSSPLIAAEKKEPSKELSQPKEASAAKTEHTMFVPADLKWGDGPPGLPAGAKLAILEGNPGKKGAFTLRLQFPDGYKIPAHTHPTAEKVTVISGTLMLGMGDKIDQATAHEMPAGGFAIMPAGMKHFAGAKGEAIVQVSGIGPFEIKYVNPADDPRKAKP